MLTGLFKRPLQALIPLIRELSVTGPEVFSKIMPKVSSRARAYTSHPPKTEPWKFVWFFFLGIGASHLTLVFFDSSRLAGIK